MVDWSTIVSLEDPASCFPFSKKFADETTPFVAIACLSITPTYDEALMAFMHSIVGQKFPTETPELNLARWSGFFPLRVCNRVHQGGIIFLKTLRNSTEEKRLSS